MNLASSSTLRREIRTASSTVPSVALAMVSYTFSRYFLACSKPFISLPASGGRFASLPRGTQGEGQDVGDSDEGCGCGGSGGARAGGDCAGSGRDGEWVRLVGEGVADAGRGRPRGGESRILSGFHTTGETGVALRGRSESSES
jgi:hypothetical protein